MEDILEALVLYYKNDRPMVYDTLIDLNEMFTRNPKETSEIFVKLMREDCKVQNLCPMCYSYLKTKKDIVNRNLDFQGIPINESEYIRYCDCGWRETNNDA